MRFGHLIQIANRCCILICAMAVLLFACVAVVPGCTRSSQVVYCVSGPPSGVHSPMVGGSIVGLESTLAFDADFNTEAYDRIVENPFYNPLHEPLSTFAIDVDTASYSNVRRMIDHGDWPIPGAVRIEEMINYFQYDYEPPTDRDRPFAAHVEITDCPWNREHRLASIGIKAWDVEHEDRPPANLVFVIDVSGSMNSPDKLPLLQKAMSMLAREVRVDDRIGIVVYSGAASVELESTKGSRRDRIVDAIESLRPGGSTNGEDGLQLGYDMATRNFIEGGINRILLATDGDFNTGTTSRSQLVRMIENKADTGVYLTILGFGTGNYKDARLEELADHGNGNYAYIDTIHEARRTLIDRMGGTLITVAKDVKIQVEFNPAEVAEYRLIGYENRLMAAQDFYIEDKDAGEIGAGHTVTAIYEIVPTGVERNGPVMDDLIYQKRREVDTVVDDGSGEMFTVRIRYKSPQDEPGDEISVVAVDDGGTIAECTDDLRLAAAVAEFSLLLRDSEFKGEATFDQVLGLLRDIEGDDPFGERSELLQLIMTAERLQSSGDGSG